MKYESIVGLSGGLDSSMTAYLLAKKGIRPLAFVFDNTWNTDIANENISNVLDYTGFDYLIINVDWEQFKDLQLAFLKSGISNIEVPTDHVLFALIYKIAEMVGAKTIYNGGNTQSEGVMPEEWSYNARDLRLIKAIHKQFGTKPMDKIPTLSLWGFIWHKFIKRIKVIQPLESYDYRIDEAKELLKKEMGWQDYGEKHEESIYTKWFQQVFLPEKFGIDKRIAHLQSLVDSKQMAKQEMERKLLLRVCPNPKEFESLYGKIGMSKEGIMAIPKKTPMNYPNSDKAWKFWTNLWMKIKLT